MSGMRLWLSRLTAAVLSLICLFFVFYTIRLLYVTRGLTAVRAGGNGTYIGAVAFPILALLFGWVAWRLVRSTEPPTSEGQATEK